MPPPVPPLALGGAGAAGKSVGVLPALVGGVLVFLAFFLARGAAVAFLPGSLGHST
jgi:hypothetical protein